MAKDLTTPEAAEVLGVSPDTLRMWADKKLVRHIRLPSGQLRFKPADLEAILTPVEPSTPETDDRPGLQAEAV